jgi:phytoene dehydrogenase-like protein
LVGAEVSKILIEDGRAVGVTVRKHDIRAAIIMSSAGAMHTFSHLVPLEDRAPFTRALADMSRYGDRYGTLQGRATDGAVGSSPAHVYVFVGLRGSQAELKLPGGC